MSEEVVVVDSNVLVKWFILEDFSDSARLLRNDHLNGYITALTPKYALLEFSNAMRKYVERGILSREDALKALDLLLEAGLKYVDIMPDYLSEALNYGMRKGITTYDAYYLVIAKKTNTNLYTADERLLKKLRDIGEVKAKHIREYRHK